MYRVMVVDDEKWIRRGIIQMVPWQKLGLELIGEAGDGNDAYDMALELKPDLLFLDMRMPGLEGKQLLAMLDEALPDLLTIVVSGYSDFEYTKEAIRHRAFDYLLKPVRKEELAAVLEKAVQELDRRREERQESGRESWLLAALFRQEAAPVGEEAAGASPWPDGWHAGECLVLVGLPDRYREEDDALALLPALEERLGRERPFLFSGRWDCALASAPDAGGELIAAVRADRLADAELQRFASLLQQTLKERTGVSYSFGASERTDGPRGLRAAYRQARQALRQKPVGAAGAMLHAGAAADCPACVYPSDKEAAFLLALQMGEEEAARAAFEELFAAMAAEDVTVEHLQRSAAMLVHALEKQLLATGARLEDVCGASPLAFTETFRRRCDAASAKAVLETEVLQPVLAHFCRPAGKLGEQAVRDAVKLIETHYDQPLSLNRVAGSHYMNPDYFSRLFKKATGHTFVDYLTEYRIRKSQELMKSAKYKNYEIAQMVGYEDYRYFSQIFKKKTGMTIGEYRSSSGQAE